MEIYHVKIKRSHKDGNYWEHFEVPLDPDSNVIQLLEHIRRRPVNQKSEPVSAVAFESSCQLGQCGTCLAVINGKPTLMCQAKLKDLPYSFSLEPLETFSVIKDLIVDKKKIFSDLAKLEDIPLIDSLEPQPDYHPTYKHKELHDSYNEACVNCGACLEVCPQYKNEGAFGGALVALKAWGLLQNNPRLKNEKLNILVSELNLYECDGANACVKACPAQIPLDQMWAEMKGFLNRGFFKTFLS